MKKNLKEIPQFKTEEEERDFWSSNDGTDYFNFGKGEVTDADSFHAGLKPVTIRFSANQLNLIRRIAKSIDVGYQSLIKVWIDERLLREKEKRIAVG